MNTEGEVKRGPGRPRKQVPQPIEPKPGEPVIGHYSNLENLDPVPKTPIQVIRLGDVYSMIDVAPVEWLPSILAKLVKRGIKEGVWSSVENLILSVRGFSK